MTLVEPGGSDPPETKNAGKSKILGWIGAVTAFFAAVAVLEGAIGNVGEKFPAACQALHICAERVPILPDYTSPRVEGGHNPKEMCGDQLRKYQEENPKFKITWAADPDEHIQKSSIFHGSKVTYQYTCYFKAEIQ